MVIGINFLHKSHMEKDPSIWQYQTVRLHCLLLEGC
jgi:hypothetical protein